ncbi:MAG: HEAT repeat domain-containing protein [Pirellulaceae bacterium]|nr:HEAT repeat domain-containing protein [Pirellulaceae bacterium]
MPSKQNLVSQASRAVSCLGTTAALGTLAFGLALASGCTDGPFYQMKKMNPYFQSQWKKDRALGPTFTDRLAELDLLQSQLARMPEAEQQQWTEQLSRIIQKDPSAEMRARAVATVAQLPSDSAVTALNFASGDDVEKVRLAACHAWKLRGGEAARDMLMSLAETDESTSVRQAAIEGLSVFELNEVKSTLIKLLSDRSPAVQFQVAQSLKSLTGRDYGGDFETWKQFMAGEEVPEPPQPSLAERAWNSLPSWK